MNKPQDTTTPVPGSTPGSQPATQVPQGQPQPDQNKPAPDKA